MKKQVSFSRQLTEDQLPGSGRVNGANKKTRPTWGLGERSNSMNQSIFIRESPDLFRHSPASVLNQQRRHQLFVSRSAQNSSMASYSTGDERSPSQIRSASSNERAATPIPMQVYKNPKFIKSTDTSLKQLLILKERIWFLEKLK